MQQPSDQPERLHARLHRALGPIGGGLLLDFLDLTSYGALGLYGGFALGGLVGWWLGGVYEFSREGRAAGGAGAARPGR